MRTHENIYQGDGLAPSGQLRIPKDVVLEKHIAQFWNPPNYRQELETYAQHRSRLIQEVASGIGVPYELIKNYTWAQHNLIWELHRNGNNKSAVAIAKDIEVTKRDPVIHTLMIKTAAILRHENLDLWGHEGLDENELETMVENIRSTNKRELDDKERWKREWKQELQGLIRIPAQGWESGFGPDSPAHWTIAEAKHNDK